MKYFALAVLLVVMQASPLAPRQTADNSRGGTPPIQQDAATNQSSPSSTVPAKNTKSASADQDSRNSPSNPNEHITVVIQQPTSVSGWEKTYVVLTGLLVIVGAVGIAYAIRTLQAVERQAKANEDQLTEIQQSAEKTDRMILIAAQGAETSKLAAIAAQRQAEYLVNSERPLLMIEASGFPLVSVKAVNKGKTTARIVFWNNFPHTYFPLAAGDMRKPSYGELYEDSRVEIINIPPIPPGGEMDVGSYDVRAVQNSDPELWEQVRTLKRFFYLYSAIKYKGFLSDDIYESRWCFMVRTIGPLMAGDPGYNQYT